MRPGTHTQQPLLELRGLKTWLYMSRGIVHAVDGVDLTVFPGESVGLVGESGCGKTMTARSVLRLLPEPPARIIGGQVLFGGKDLLALSNAKMEQVRGAEIAMVFQDPFTYLNPTMCIGDQIAEAVWLHQGAVGVDNQVGQALERVGLPADADFRRRYPHELSGGMRQRVLIAIALACQPKLLIADEPTTALDVTLQAQILALLCKLRVELSLALLLITHDLGIVAELCDRVYVMYAGQVIEEAAAVNLFEQPNHPYTQGLLAGALSIEEFRPVLKTIPGTVPDLVDPDPGCRFCPRCAQAFGDCMEDPPLITLGAGSVVRCWLYATAGSRKVAVDR
ncbi:MAG: ABC transporter ATP-binding protein [Chloroflexi bacterium]|nr:ABC transporter ATP-binding protein [Chloroflexota bacterium]MCL5076085.1 ABC transporter ATP-binding protein [Chloroflexota bacterium]